MSKNLNETHRDIFEHDMGNNRDAMKMAIKECPYVHDDGEI